MKKLITALTLVLGFANAAFAQLPQPGFVIDGNTAIVITDPQVDFLSPEGVTWGVVGESVTANNTVANLETIFKLAEQKNIQVFVSPHYYYPHDHKWQFEGVLETLMHNINMFERKDPLSLEEFDKSGADFMPQYKA